MSWIIGALTAGAHWLGSAGIAQVALGGLVQVATSVLTGRFMRRTVLLPFELAARWTSTPLDDKLVEDLQADLGIDPSIPKEQTDAPREE